MHIFDSTGCPIIRGTVLWAKPAMHKWYHHLLSGESFRVILRMVIVTTSVSRLIFGLGARRIRSSAVFMSFILLNRFVRNFIKCRFTANTCSGIFLSITWWEEATNWVSWRIMMQKTGTTRKDRTEEKCTEQSVAPCALVLAYNVVLE